MDSNNRVIITATDYPTNYDKYFRNRLDNLMKRAVRHKDRFKEIDLPEFQAQVNQNISRLQTKIQGRYVGLLDLMNYVQCDRSLPDITPYNTDHYLTHAGMITLNGIYLYQYLSCHGFDPHIIQNDSLVDIKAELTPKPLAVCISSNFIYLDEIADMADEVKTIDPKYPCNCWRFMEKMEICLLQREKLNLWRWIDPALTGTKFLTRIFVKPSR